ncbi:EAL domain-containing protein [Algibacillus agarilyticus]|uniref:EAL domain-containing protein n=1 Tax=Algibacillus agarilyticus TaxID=2234133 RepID=UPI000DCF8048|nr:EAL domain-containing protein [Algibacillus agarilyticus]
MYQAKADTQNPIIIYSDELSHKMNQFIDIQNAINSLRQQLTAQTYFQPIIQNNKTISLEALTRFDDPVLRDIQQTFNLIGQHKHGKSILWQIIELNLATYGELKQTFKGAIPHININVDMDLMEESTFTEQLNRLLAEHHIAAKQVYLEITESETSKAIGDSVFQTLDILKSLGYRISLDDFGTGYSSIERVMRLGFDQIKIDKIFINNNFSTEQKYTALQAAVNLGRALNLELLIEGIETPEDQALAQKCGISLLQGYFFAKPMSLNGTLHFLEQENGQ